LAGRAEDSPEPAREGKPILGCRLEEANGWLSPRGDRRKGSEAAENPSALLGGSCPLRVRVCRWGRAGPAGWMGVKPRRDEGKKRRGVEPRLPSQEQALEEGVAQLVGPRTPTVALVVAGEGWGFSLCSKPLRGQVSPSPPLLRDPRALPLPECPAALPSGEPITGPISRPEDHDLS